MNNMNDIERQNAALDATIRRRLRDSVPQRRQLLVSAVTLAEMDATFAEKASRLLGAEARAVRAGGYPRYYPYLRADLFREVEKAVAETKQDLREKVGRPDIGPSWAGPADWGTAGHARRCWEISCSVEQPELNRKWAARSALHHIVRGDPRDVPAAAELLAT